MTNTLEGDEKLANLVEHLDKASGMKISAEKTKLMTNNTRGRYQCEHTDINVNKQRYVTVTSFKDQA